MLSAKYWPNYVRDVLADYSHFYVENLDEPVFQYLADGQVIAPMNASNNDTVPRPRIPRHLIESEVFENGQSNGPVDNYFEYDVDIKVSVWNKVANTWTPNVFTEAFINCGPVDNGNPLSSTGNPAATLNTTPCSYTNPNANGHMGWWTTADALYRIRGYSGSAINDALNSRFRFFKMKPPHDGGGTTLSYRLEWTITQRAKATGATRQFKGAQNIVPRSNQGTLFDRPPFNASHRMQFGDWLGSGTFAPGYPQYTPNGAYQEALDDQTAETRYQLNDQYENNTLIYYTSQRVVGQAASVRVSDFRDKLMTLFGAPQPILNIPTLGPNQTVAFRLSSRRWIGPFNGSSQVTQWRVADPWSLVWPTFYDVVGDQGFVGFGPSKPTNSDLAYGAMTMDQANQLMALGLNFSENGDYDQTNPGASPRLHSYRIRVEARIFTDGVYRGKIIRDIQALPQDDDYGTRTPPFNEDYYGWHPDYYRPQSSFAQYQVRTPPDLNPFD